MRRLLCVITRYRRTVRITLDQKHLNNLIAMFDVLAKPVSLA